MEINKHTQDIKKEMGENKETNQTNEIKEEKKEKESFLRRLYNEFKIGFKKNYKILILITIVALIIIYLNIPQKLYNNIMIGGDNGNGQGDSGGKGNKNGNEGGEKKKKSFMSKFSPLSGGINIMYWVAQNIILFYLFLIFLVLIPSVPIVLYITIFYFIMSGLLGRITNV
jgi:hypothetical protein